MVIGHEQQTTSRTAPLTATLQAKRARVEHIVNNIRIPTYNEDAATATIVVRSIIIRRLREKNNEHVKRFVVGRRMAVEWSNCSGASCGCRPNHHISRHRVHTSDKLIINGLCINLKLTTVHRALVR